MEEKTNWFFWGVAAVLTLGFFGTGIWVPAFRPMLTIAHILICTALILVVLLQSGRAADLAGAFGGAGSQTAFGPRGAATFMSKATEFLAIVFMLSSLVLGAISTQSVGAAGAMPATAPGVEQLAPVSDDMDPAGATFGEEQDSEDAGPAEDDSSSEEE